MMYKGHTNYPVLMVIVLFMLASCAQEELQPATRVTASQISELKLFLSDVTDTDLSKISFNSEREHFLIDGDLVMPLEKAKAHYKKFLAINESDPSGRKKQRRYTFLMSNAVAEDVTIFVNAGVPAQWLTAMDEAIANWNSVDSRIGVTRVFVQAGASMSISMGSLPPKVIAQASLPDAAGNCGPTITINPNYNGLSATKKEFAMTHELGHCFGFLHTNQAVGSIITDTPVTDANSVMNSVVLDWNGFTFYDFVAYGVTYPNHDGTRRFLRYYNVGHGGHLYTTFTAELGPGLGGWVPELGAGYIFTSNTAGTVPLYRYSHPNNDHLYTTNFGELGNGTNGWVYEGIAGYVSSSAVAGTKPLYRYYHTNDGHFYTIDFGELGNGINGWVLEGIAGYVW